MIYALQNMVQNCYLYSYNGQQFFTYLSRIPEAILTNFFYFAADAALSPRDVPKIWK